ncbi:MAG: cytochrome b [Hyphomicrobiaceae bacterium]
MTRSPRYGAVAIGLHWATALFVLVLLGAGLWMTDAIKAPETRNFAFKVYQWHKSLGLTVLVLTVVRILWRVMNPPPPLPAGMTRFERGAASLAHAGLYALMLAIPLAGWAMVSASPLGFPTMVFGLFEWPHLPMLASLEDKKPAEALFKMAHKYLAFGAMALIALHVIAALKHHFVNRDDVLARMLPGVRAAQKSSIG